MYDATAEPINLYERTRRYVKDVTVLFVTAMAEQYLEKVTEKVITKLSDTKFIRGFMDFVMEEDLLTGISDRILLARMYFAESDAEVFGKLSKYLEEDALTYLNAEIGKTGLKPRDVAKTLLKCARKNDDTTLSLDDARFVLRELRLGTEESAVVSLFREGKKTVQLIYNKFPGEIQEGKRFDFSIENGRIKMQAGIRYVDFIIDMGGNLHIGRGHLYLSGDNPVQAAGKIKVNAQGYIRLITNESGHFQPTVAQAWKYPAILRNAGLNVDNAWIRIEEFETDTLNYVINSKVFYNGPVKNLF